MARKYFKLPNVPPYTLVRVDDQPAPTDSPADILTTEGQLPIPGAILRADRFGDMPDVLGPDGASSLYLKAQEQNVTLTGEQTNVPDLTSSTSNDLAGAAGNGLEYTNGQFGVKLSADGGNALGFGTDHGLYAATGSGGGGTGGAQAYKFTQTSAATVWTIVHNLGFDPAGATVYSSDGYQLDAFGVQVLTPGTSLRLSFDLAFAGTAYLS